MEKRTGIAVQCDKICNKDGIQIHTRLTGTEAVFTERTIQTRLEKCFLPLHGRPWIRVPSQNVSIRRIPGFQRKNA